MIIDYFANKKKKPECRLLVQKWKILRELNTALKVAYDATISLQKRDLTLSDTYGIWLKMTLHLEALTTRKSFVTDLPKRLLSELGKVKRDDAIFKNPFMCCALFLDPRFHSQITKDDEKTNQAKKTLITLWHRIDSCISQSSRAQENANNMSSKSDSSFEFDANSAMAAFLVNNENNSFYTEQLSNGTDIEFILDIFNPEQLSHEKSVLEYWESIKEDNKELYKLALIIFSIPPTEVQIERDFSRLNFVFSDRRCRLTEERLGDIMGIHLNNEVFFIVKAEEIAELEKKLLL